MPSEATWGCQTRPWSRVWPFLLPREAINRMIVGLVLSFCWSRDGVSSLHVNHVAGGLFGRQVDAFDCEVPGLSGSGRMAPCAPCCCSVMFPAICTLQHALLLCALLVRLVASVRLCMITGSWLSFGQAGTGNCTSLCLFEPWYLSSLVCPIPFICGCMIVGCDGDGFTCFA